MRSSTNRGINGARDCQGSALVEIVFGICALFIPLALGISAIVTIYHGAATAEIVARETARAFVLGTSDIDAWARAHRAAQQAFSDSGMTFRQPQIRCSNSPCLSPGAGVEVRVMFTVPVVLGTWRVSASHRQEVDPWRSLP